MHPRIYSRLRSFDCGIFPSFIYTVPLALVPLVGRVSRKPLALSYGVLDLSSISNRKGMNGPQLPFPASWVGPTQSCFFTAGAERGEPVHDTVVKILQTYSFCTDKKW